MEIVNCPKNQDSFENLQEENEEEINKINKEEQKQDLEKKINLEIDKSKDNSLSNMDKNNTPQETPEKPINDNKENNANQYIFNNIIKIKTEKSSQKLLDEQWKHQKILLDYNLLDFTCKNY